MNEASTSPPDVSLAALRALQRAKRAPDVGSATQVQRRQARSGTRHPDRVPLPDPDAMVRIQQAVGGLLAHEGWAGAADQARLHARWREIAGEDIADHTAPGPLRDNVLSIEATSTAWATQLRLLAPALIERVNALLGDAVVRSLDIRGPQAPSWRAGPRTVPGRGPRDTYG